MRWTNLSIFAVVFVSVVSLAAVPASANTALQRLAVSCGVLPSSSASSSSSSCDKVVCVADCGVSSGRCPFGKRCAAVPTGANTSALTCTNSSSIGNPCTVSLDCADYLSGAFCSPLTHRCSRPLLAGEPCDPADSHCRQPLLCGSSGTCYSPNGPSRGIGQSCGNSSVGHCYLSLACVDGVCRALPSSAGDKCTLEYGCELPMMCSAESLTCVDLLSIPKGGNCSFGTSLHCAAGLVCEDDGECDTADSDPKEERSGCPCKEDAYCACDATVGGRRCFPRTVSTAAKALAFRRLAECVRIDPDYGMERCGDLALAVLRAVNASETLDANCARPIGPTVAGKTKVSPVALIVPVAVVALILVLVLVVRLGGAPKQKGISTD